MAETKSALGKLSTFNSVGLLWVPGHNNVPGNEIADKLVKQAAASEGSRDLRLEFWDHPYLGNVLS